MDRGRWTIVNGQWSVVTDPSFTTGIQAPIMPSNPSDKAALRGEPSYVWRAGQERRLEMIQRAAGDRLKGNILETGCGMGMYLQRLAVTARMAVGLEIESERAQEAAQKGLAIICGAGEKLPLPGDHFDLVLSNEVLEHVQDDRSSIQECVRVLKSGGRLVLFVPNRGYPFETHGIYWKGQYQFGNKFGVNYLPKKIRNRLAPHVRVYSAPEIEKLLEGLPVRVVGRTIIFGAYDNIIARWPAFGKTLRNILYRLEKTPLRSLGLSHFWIIEKI